MKRALYVIMAVLLLPGFLFILRSGSQAQNPKDSSKGWVDYDAADLTQKDRLKQRPGNYPILAALSEFLDDWYRVRPDYSRCAFPFQDNSKTFQTLEDVEKFLDERAKGGRAPKNKLRQFNINVSGLSVYDPDKALQSPEILKKVGSKSQQDRLAAVRKAHPGRAVLVLADLELESLQSSKVEGGGPTILYLIHAGGRWKVAWIDT